MGRLRYRVSTRAKFAVAILAGGLLTAPVAVLASHQFTDVGSGHLFHKEIGVVADAGIARGFGDGTYRPSDNVTRQAMAAFLERGIGRAGAGRLQRTIGNAPGTPKRVVVGQVGIDPGATARATGFVVLVGEVRAQTAEIAACPCRVLIELAENGLPLACEHSPGSERGRRGRTGARERRGHLRGPDQRR